MSHAAWFWLLGQSGADLTARGNLDSWSILFAIGIGLLLMGVVSGGRPRVAAGREFNHEGHPKVYTLTLGVETISLDPGKPWIRADAYKWSARGLVEEPQSFHVLPDGTIDINGEHIALNHPEGERRLEHEINKHHDAPIDLSRGGKVVGIRASEDPARAPSDHVRFRVRLDHLAHLCVEAFRGEERSETGLRGLSGLVQNGLLLPLPAYHIDPLQRSIEIEGVQYEATESGAAALERLLNDRFAPVARPPGDRQISIRENPASSTGFDIRFVTSQSGMRVEVKGHLNQDRLNVLQDHSRCDLLREGLLVRLIPPLLLIRRKRPDGGEDRISELPDVAYRRVTAARLQELFNHPALRAGDLPTPEPPPPIPVGAGETLPIEAIQPAPPAAGEMPVEHAHRISDPTPPAALAPGHAPQPPASESPAAPRPIDEDADLAREAGLEAFFQDQDPLHVHNAIFRHLHRALAVDLQDVRLSLDRVFENRRFEILSFSHPAISAIGEIRSEDFYGWYLSHVEPRDLLLVYACAGCHMEWGSRKCVLQTSLRAEAEEFPGSALRGLLQDASGNFVFVVSPQFRTWVRHREGECRRAFLRFITPHELAASPDAVTYIWPER